MRWGRSETNLCNECTRNGKRRLKPCLSCTEALISPPQLSPAQIKNDLREQGLTAATGLPFQANYKVHIKHEADDGAAAKVFIYIKRLSTYIIGIIIKKGNLKRKLHIMTHYTFP